MGPRRTPLLGTCLLGLVCLAMLMAARPAEAQDIQEVLQQIQRRDPPAGGADLAATMFGDELATGGDLGGQRRVPLTHLELGSSTSGFNPLPNFLSFQARLTFTLARWFIAAAQWLLAWVLRFELGQVLTGPVATLAEGFDRSLIGGLGLHHLALLLAVTRAAWLFLRHRAHAGLTEVLVALAISVVGFAMMNQVEETTCGGLSVLGGTTHAVLVLGLDPDAGDLPPPQACAVDAQPHELVTSFRQGVVQTFVVQPYLLLQWGEVPSGACRDVAHALLERGAWGDDDFPREQMEDAGCDRLAEFNAHMGADRLVGGLAHLVATAGFALAILAVVGTLLVAQVAGAVLVVVMPFALLAGIAPGAGRELLARWFHGVLKVSVLFLGSAFFLVVLIVVVDAVQEAMADEAIALRLSATAAVAWILVLMRTRLMRTLRFTAHSVAARTAGPDADVGPVGRAPGDVVGGAAASAAAKVGRLKQAGAVVAAVAGGGGVAATGRSQRLLTARLQTHTTAATSAAATATAGRSSLPGGAADPAPSAARRVTAASHAAAAGTAVAQVAVHATDGPVGPRARSRSAQRDPQTRSAVDPSQHVPRRWLLARDVGVEGLGVELSLAEALRPDDSATLFGGLTPIALSPAPARSARSGVYGLRRQAPGGPTPVRVPRRLPPAMPPHTGS